MITSRGDQSVALTPVTWRDRIIFSDGRAGFDPPSREDCTFAHDRTWHIGRSLGLCRDRTSRATYSDAPSGLAGGALAGTPILRQTRVSALRRPDLGSQLRSSALAVHAGQQDASFLATEHLRPDIARVVCTLLEHEPRDLNVSRVAYTHGVSRWTLGRRLHAKTGLHTKELVALAQLCTALSRLLDWLPGEANLRGANGSPLTRVERGAIRRLLGIRPVQLKRAILIGGRKGLQELLRAHLSHKILRSPNDADW